jgi:hypothetical protein
MEPELQQQRAFGDEHPLEVADALEAPREFRALFASQGALQDRVRVPGTEEDADSALGRKRLPETPHLGPRALDVGELAEGARGDVARIHPFVQQVDGLALAGAVDAVHQDHHGKLPPFEQLVLEREQALAQLGLLALELGLSELVADLGGFEHRSSPWVRPAPTLPDQAALGFAFPRARRQKRGVSASFSRSTLNTSGSPDACAANQPRAYAANASGGSRSATSRRAVAASLARPSASWSETSTPR